MSQRNYQDPMKVKRFRGGEASKARAMLKKLDKLEAAKKAKEAR